VVELAGQNTCFAADKSFLVKQTAHLARLLLEFEKSKAETEAAIIDMVKDDADVEGIDAIHGVSTVQAATFMAEVRSIDCFNSEARMASYAGIALKRLQTGTSLNIQRNQWRANRHLKLCILGIAETLSMNDSRSKDYYRKKVAEGKTHRQALRALARHVIRRFYRILKNNRRRLLQEAQPQAPMVATKRNPLRNSGGN
jgi:transposase